jgi:hypothetical protein
MREFNPEHAAEIDARSEKLQAEFLEHAAEFRERLKAERADLLGANGRLNKSRVFEGWAIQKIAGLQLLVLNLVSRVQELGRERGSFPH